MKTVVVSRQLEDGMRIWRGDDFPVNLIVSQARLGGKPQRHLQPGITVIIRMGLEEVDLPDTFHREGEIGDPFHIFEINESNHNGII